MLFLGFCYLFLRSHILSFFSVAGGLASKVLKNKMQQLNAARKDFQGLSDRIISHSHGSRWKTPENGLPSSVPSTDRVHGLSLCPSKLLKIDRLGGIRHRLHDPKSRHQRLPEFEDHWDNPEDSLWNNGFDCTNLLEDVIMKDVDESQLTAPSHLGLCQDLAAHGLRMVAMARFVDASVSWHEMEYEQLKVEKESLAERLAQLKDVENKIIGLEKELSSIVFEKDSLAMENDKLKDNITSLEIDNGTLAAMYDLGAANWAKLEGDLRKEIEDLKQGYAEQYKEGFDSALAQVLVVSPDFM